MATDPVSTLYAIAVQTYIAGKQVSDRRSLCLQKVARVAEALSDALGREDLDALTAMAVTARREVKHTTAWLADSETDRDAAFLDFARQRRERLLSMDLLLETEWNNAQTELLSVTAGVLRFIPFEGAPDWEGRVANLQEALNKGSVQEACLKSDLAFARFLLKAAGVPADAVTSFGKGLQMRDARARSNI
jgi:hypothetical protein